MTGVSATSGTKRCSDCGSMKALEEFRANRARPDGLSFYCRACSSKREKEAYRRRQANKGKTVLERFSAQDGHKRCPRCETWKPFDEWPKNKRTKDGYGSYCKLCHNKRGAQDHLRRTYNLGTEDIRQMVAGQGGLCPICLNAPAEQVDHDHATGAVRAVLCFNCNGGLGQFKDRPDVLRRAARYLEGDVWRPTSIAPGVYQLPT